MACGSTHPEMAGVRCIATDRNPNHDRHFAMHSGQPVEWENVEYVAPAPRGTSRAEAAEKLKALADQVPAPERRVDDDAVILHRDPHATEMAAALRAFPGSGTQRRRVLDLVMSRPDGATDYEMSVGLGIGLNSIRPRRTELLDGEWIQHSGRVRLTDTGSEAIVWVATERARRESRG